MKRTIVEKYVAYGDNRKEALENCAENGDAHSVELKNETCVRVKE